MIPFSGDIPYICNSEFIVKFFGCFLASLTTAVFSLNDDYTCQHGILQPGKLAIWMFPLAFQYKSTCHSLMKRLPFHAKIWMDKESPTEHYFPWLLLLLLNLLPVSASKCPHGKLRLLHEFVIWLTYINIYINKHKSSGISDKHMHDWLIVPGLPCL